MVYGWSGLSLGYKLSCSREALSPACLQNTSLSSSIMFAFYETESDAFSSCFFSFSFYSYITCQRRQHVQFQMNTHKKSFSSQCLSLTSVFQSHLRSVCLMILVEGRKLLIDDVSELLGVHSVI